MMKPNQQNQKRRLKSPKNEASMCHNIADPHARRDCLVKAKQLQDARSKGNRRNPMGGGYNEGY